MKCKIKVLDIANNKISDIESIRFEDNMAVEVVTYPYKDRLFNYPSAVAQFELVEFDIPGDPVAVLALITGMYDTGKSSWYEVVYYDNGEWQSYAGSKTFNDGEKVIKWKYADECV